MTEEQDEDFWRTGDVSVKRHNYHRHLLVVQAASRNVLEPVAEALVAIETAREIAAQLVRLADEAEADLQKSHQK